MDLFGIGLLELLTILVLALIVLGPERMVSTARTLGRVVRQVRRAGQEMSDAVWTEESERSGRGRSRPSNDRDAPNR